MREIEEITSRRNPRILLACALQSAKTRREEGLFCFEGRKLFDEAAHRGAPLTSVFVREDVALEEQKIDSLPPECRIFRVTKEVYEKISFEKSPEGIFCIAKTLDKFHKFATIYNKREKLPGARTALFAVSVRDPGNLGSIIRSAAAFSCSELILSEDCADLYNSKTVRASMGTLFDFPITVVSDTAGTVDALTGAYRVYAAALRRGALTPDRVPPEQSCCFLVGNEGHGLPKELIERCDGALFIPMSDGAESLNASVAASILLYDRYMRTERKKNLT